MADIDKIKQAICDREGLCKDCVMEYVCEPKLKAIAALIAADREPLVEALTKIRNDFVPDKGQEQLALSEIRECADKALEGR